MMLLMYSYLSLIYCLSIEFVGYSLVQQGNPGALNPDSIIYYVHDIVLDYLKDTIPKEKQVHVHVLVISNSIPFKINFNV